MCIYLYHILKLSDMNTTYKVQTCNGNPEVIKVVNGIAKEIVAGEKRCLSMVQAKAIAKELNRTK
jgi:hypothetical protein